MNTRIRVALGLCLVASIAASASGVEIWAVDNLAQNNAGTVGDRVIKFDSANPTGTVVTVGATGQLNEGMSGLDFANNGVLYAASGFHSTGGVFPGSRLYTINQANGAATLVGSMGLPAGTAVTDLSWNPVSNQMLALTFNATGNVNSLYSVNLGNGSAALIGTITGMAGALDIGLASNSAGVNYVHNLADDRMYVLTGLAAAPMAAGIGIDTNFSQGMTINWRGADEWYLGSLSNTPVFASQVRLMNNATGGTAAILGTWPNNGTGGLPQYETGDLAIIPEPAVLTLLGFALAARGIRRRSKR